MGVIEDATEEELLKMLADGVKAILDHGDFGKASPQGAMVQPIQNELLFNRGWSEANLNKKIAELLEIEVPEGA